MIRITGGEARGRKLKTPFGLSVRPTLGRIRETLFNILQNKVPGSSFLDIFAGSGVVGIEALSRGARYALFIEKSRKMARLIIENLAICKFQDRGEIIIADVMEAQSLMEKRAINFDIIFVDPPYQFDEIEKVIHLYIPFLERGGIMILQHKERFSIALPARFHVKIKKIGKHHLTFIKEREDG